MNNKLSIFIFGWTSLMLTLSSLSVTRSSQNTPCPDFFTSILCSRIILPLDSCLCTDISSSTYNTQILKTGRLQFQQCVSYLILWENFEFTITDIDLFDRCSKTHVLALSYGHAVASKLLLEYLFLEIHQLAHLQSDHNPTWHVI